MINVNIATSEFKVVEEDEMTANNTSVVNTIEFFHK